MVSRMGPRSLPVVRRLTGRDPGEERRAATRDSREDLGERFRGSTRTGFAVSSLISSGCDHSEGRVRCE